LQPLESRRILPDMATMMSKGAAAMARKRAAGQSPERRIEIAREAAKARWRKHRAKRAKQAS